MFFIRSCCIMLGVRLLLLH